MKIRPPEKSTDEMERLARRLGKMKNVHRLASHLPKDGALNAMSFDDRVAFMNKYLDGRGLLIVEFNDYDLMNVYKAIGVDLS